MIKLILSGNPAICVILLLQQMATSDMPTTASLNGTLVKRPHEFERVAQAQRTEESVKDNPSTTKKRVKYRHVAAVHARSRISCLSSDSETNPSFLGFRNLMVIVVSKSFSLSSVA